jgi:hypothetical protein
MSADKENLEIAKFLNSLRDYPEQRALMVRAFLEMRALAEEPTQRERYEARRKFWLDIESAMSGARKEGRIEGEIGRIHLCERLLKRPLTPTEQFARRSAADVIQLADELQAQVLKPE